MTRGRVGFGGGAEKRGSCVGHAAVGVPVEAGAVEQPLVGAMDPSGYDRDRWVGGGAEKRGSYVGHAAVGVPVEAGAVEQPLVGAVDRKV